MGEHSSLAERIRGYREACGLTQKRLAESLNLDTTSIAKYETGVASPKLETLRRMAAVFCVPFETLAIGEPVRSHVLSDNELPFERSFITEFKHLTNEEQLLVMQFRQLTDEQCVQLQQFVQQFLNET